MINNMKLLTSANKSNAIRKQKEIKSKNKIFLESFRIRLPLTAMYDFT